MYMPEIGRWGVVDPMANKYFGISPYVYAANIPTILIDPNGMELYFSQLETRAERKEFRKRFREMKGMGETGKSTVKYLKSKESGKIVLTNKENGTLGSFRKNERVTNELGGEPMNLTLDGFKPDQIGGELNVDLETVKAIGEKPIDVFVEEAAHAAINSMEANTEGNNIDIGSKIGRGTDEFTAKAIVGQIELESGRKIQQFANDEPARAWGRETFRTGSTQGFFQAAENWRSQQTGTYRNAALGTRVPALLKKLIKN
jgi:hypothetical protein